MPSGSKFAPAPAPAPADALSQLALALQGLMDQASITTAVQPRPYVPDYRKDLNMTAWPSCSGDFRTFRIYKKDVLFTLGMLPQEAHDKVVPYLTRASATDFKHRWMRGNYNMADYDGPSGLGRFFAEIKKMSGAAPVDELFSSFT